MHQAFILGCILLGTLFVLKRSRDPKLNAPPFVRYNIPIIGHTFNYLLNCEKFLKQCREEYGDIFSLYIWGRTISFVGREHIHEVLSRDDVFDFRRLFRRKFPGDVMFTNAGGFGGQTDNARIVKEYISNKLGLYTERMQKSLSFATQKYIGDCDDRKVIKDLYHLSTKIISTSIANIFIGEEEAKHDDVIATFAEFTIDAAIFLVIPPFLDFIYPGLQDYINRVIIRIGLYNPSNKHRDVLVKHIKNQVDKRLQEKRKHGDSWNRPNDLLQDFMDEKFFDSNNINNINNINYAAIADKMAIFIFASIHTTSRSCANAIMDLASRPEYMQELYEEQLEIYKKADKNGILPYGAVNEMKKLDNFVRESLRLTGDVSALQHLALEGFTFSNGLQIPKEHIVELYYDDVMRDESLQGPNPKSFEPYRKVNINAPASKVGRNFVAFGGGKHACPGRYFAVNEVKFFMHNAILKYNFRTESGKIEEKSRIGPITFPSSSGIVFEKRN